MKRVISLKSRKKRLTEIDRVAAQLIIEQAGKHGGEDSLMLMWARAVIKQAEDAAVVKR